MQVPARLLEQWRLAGADAALLAKWQYPQAVDLTLAGDTRVEVRLMNEANAVVVTHIYTARRPGREGDFPQVEDLNGPHAPR